jgi:glycosyltransferase involved in cell wall biosynthesis
MSSNNFEIAVIVLTYNQESILNECLDSVIGQKLKSANLKIYVIDDASTDKTRTIIEDYHSKHPELISPVYYENNQYQYGKAPEIPILKNITSTHVAFCDGDDFWIDEFKLEKQIQRFIEDDSLSIVHTDYYFGKTIKSKFQYELRSNKDKDKARKIKNSFDLIQGNDIKKSTCLFRTSAINFALLDKCIGIRAQDWVIAISAGSNGGIEFMEDVTTCYRVSDQASFQSLDQKDKMLVKDEVRWFCAANLSEGPLRLEFRKYLFLQYCRELIRGMSIYRILRPLVRIFRTSKSIFQK